MMSEEILEKVATLKGMQEAVDEIINADLRNEVKNFVLAHYFEQFKTQF
ncbi:hypothetical protein [Klebsiella variicola]